MPARAPPPAPSLMLVSAGLFPLHFFFHSSLPQLLYSTFLPFLNMLLQKHHHHAGQAYLCLVSIGAIWSYLCSAWGSPGLSSQPPTTKTWTYEPSNTGRMMCSWISEKDILTKAITKETQDKGDQRATYALDIWLYHLTVSSAYVNGLP